MSIEISEEEEINKIVAEELRNKQIADCFTKNMAIRKISRLFDISHHITVSILKQEGAYERRGFTKDFTPDFILSVKRKKIYYKDLCEMYLSGQNLIEISNSKCIATVKLQQYLIRKDAQKFEEMKQINEKINEERDLELYLKYKKLKDKGMSYKSISQFYDVDSHLVENLLKSNRFFGC